MLARNSIDRNLKAKTKIDLLEKLTDLISKSGMIDDRDAAYNEILERESVMSTGIGKGIALPHAKTDAVRGSVAALAILKDPVDFNSLDDKPVEIAFMLLGKENAVGAHLRTLGKISRLLGNEAFKTDLKNCESEEEIIKLFDSRETD